MSPNLAQFDLVQLAYGLAAALHAGLLLYLLHVAGWRPWREASMALFCGAVLATAVWAVVKIFDEMVGVPRLPLAVAWSDLLRYALWFAFVWLLLRPADQGWSPGWLGGLGLMLVGAAAVLHLAEALGLQAASEQTQMAAALALAVYGLILVEQLFRNQPEEARWNAKPVCMALVCIFVFDLYIYAEAVMFGRFDADAVNVRGAVHALAVPFLVVASRRHQAWVLRMQVSRSAAFYSATLLLVGAYLLFIAAAGYYVRFFGGSWGRALQLALAFAALLFLATLMFSGALRSRLRVFLGKNFFRYRYDYRQEWLRFTAKLSARGTPQEVGVQVVQGLADLVECPAGSLWTRGLDGDDYVRSAHWNAPPAVEREPADSAFCQFLRRREWIVDLAEYRASPRQYDDLVLPRWLFTDAAAWLVVPLLVADEMTGFVVLDKPRTRVELNWEVRDLLKTASRQAAGFLARMQATEALLEARKFDAFNRMSAFVVHDLKNIITQLSLMLKNAERHRDNPEFQQDMLLTVESSLEKMRQMMLQLREGEKPTGVSSGVELVPVVKGIEQMARGRGRHLELELADAVSTRGHEQRLARVLGHVVQNALDATPPSGRVWLRLQQSAGRAMVVVGDTGAGMTPEFVQTRLFRPFSTTKQSGMGIGSYESYQYIKELGGSIEVDSELGRGTVVTILLPLFEARKGSDLQLPAEAHSQGRGR